MTNHLLRYEDLRQRGVVRNRTTLRRWINDMGFPPGLKIGPNTRVWPATEVDAWLETRQSAG